MTDEIDRLIASAAARTFEVRVCGRGDLVTRHAALAAEWLEAKNAAAGSLGGDAELSRIEQDIREVEAEQEDHTVTLTVASVSRRQWADLLAKHLPRPKDRGDLELGANKDTFPPAAVGLCVQGLTSEKADELQDALSAGEWGKLFNAAMLLNAVEVPHPKLPAATELVRANGHSSTTRQDAASPEVSS